jgi:hypothetical protein
MTPTKIFQVSSAYIHLRVILCTILKLIIIQNIKQGMGNNHLKTPKIV